MLDLADYKESKEKQEKGAPIYIGDACFMARRYGTPECNAQINTIKEELYGLWPDPKEIDLFQIWAHLLYDYLITGWECVGEDGNPIEYNKNNARLVFLNKELWGEGGLVHQIIVESMNYENYLHDKVAEDTESVKKP